jgi:probable phosphoglycerate mutase
MFTMRRYEINIKQKKEECKIIRKFAFMIQLYITRHGQTEENLQRILQGQMPGHLTQEGIHQAEELRERLKDIPFDCIFTSDLKRAKDSALIIAQPHQCPIIEEPLLRERDFGIHTGGPYIKISHALDPSAETMEQVAQRATDFLNKVSDNSTSLPLEGESEGASILAVSHGLFLRVLQAVFWGVPVRSIEKMDNAEVRMLELDPCKHYSGTLLEEVGGTAN